MGLFSFTQELAMDLGTANTIITCNDKMVVDEPSVIALDARSEKVLAVGRQAREMYEKTNPNIRTIRPLREGVIADFYAAEQMMRGLIKMASGRKRWFAPSLRMVIALDLLFFTILLANNKSSTSGAVGFFSVIGSRSASP